MHTEQTASSWQRTEWAWKMFIAAVRDRPRSMDGRLRVAVVFVAGPGLQTARVSPTGGEILPVKLIGRAF